MANLTIRNVDETIVEDLKAQAKLHNRSLEGELREILATATRRGRRARFLQEARRISAEIASQTPKDQPLVEGVEILRELREERMRDR